MATSWLGLHKFQKSQVIELVNCSFLSVLRRKRFLDSIVPKASIAMFVIDKVRIRDCFLRVKKIHLGLNLLTNN